MKCFLKESKDLHIFAIFFKWTVFTLDKFFNSQVINFPMLVCSATNLNFGGRCKLALKMKQSTF